VILEKRDRPLFFALPAIPLSLALAVGIPLPKSPPQQRAAIERADEPANNQAETRAESPDERLADYTFFLTVFTGILAVVSGIQIFFLVRADKASAKAANSTAEQLKLTLRQLRPWLAVSIRVGGDITFFDRTAGDAATKFLHAYFDVYLKNVGSSPATGVRLAYEFWDQFHQSRKPENTTEAFADAALGKADESPEGFALVPDEEIFIGKVGTKFALPKGKYVTDRALPCFLVSVVYRSDAIEGGKGQTVKVVTVLENDEATGKAITVGTPVTESNVRLRQYGVYGRAS